MRDAPAWVVSFADRLIAKFHFEGETGELWALLFDQCGLLIGVGIGLLIAAAVVGLMRRGSQGRPESEEKVLHQSGQTLDEARASLEAQAAIETSDLRGRSDRLRAVASLAREISGAPDINTLTSAATASITGSFGVHHAGIYLLDGSGPLPTLRGASSGVADVAVDGGLVVEVGEGSLVAAVVQQREPLVAHLGDPGAEGFIAHWIEGTRSELAVPIWAQDHMIGVLDLQSPEPGHFDREDIDALGIAASQLSLAIQALGGKPKPMAAPVVRAVPSGTSVDGATGATAMLSDIAVTGDGQLVVPILMRGQAVGTMVLEREVPGQPWSAEERDLARTMGMQAGLALERARLLDSLKLRTRQERLLRDLSRRLRATEDADNLVQAALGEISRALGLSVAEFQMERPARGTPWACRVVEGAAQPWSGLVDASMCEARERDAVVGGCDTASCAVAIPLRSEGRALGAMRFERSVAQGAWQDEEVALLRASADLLLGALDRADALRDAHEAAERDQALREVSHRIFQGSEIDTILQAAACETRRAMDLHSVSVRLAPLEGALVHAAGQGLEAGPAGLTLLDPLGPDRWPPDLRQAWFTQTPVAGRIETLDDPPLYHLALPVPGADNVLGVLDVARPANCGEWTPPEVRALEGLAEQLGRALHDVRYLEATRLRLQAEREAAKVPGRLYDSFDVDMVLRTAVRELQALLNLDTAEVRVGPVTPVSGTGEVQGDQQLEPDELREYDDG